MHHHHVDVVIRLAHQNEDPQLANPSSWIIRSLVSSDELPVTDAIKLYEGNKGYGTLTEQECKAELNSTDLVIPLIEAKTNSNLIDLPATIIYFTKGGRVGQMEISSMSSFWHDTASDWPNAKCSLTIKWLTYRKDNEYFF